MIYLISDTHFCHNKEFIWSKRGYKSIYEMNKDFIDKWNVTVDPKDEVYHLGDVMLSDMDEGMHCVHQLNGLIHLIRGNHDTDSKIELLKTSNNIIDITYADMLKTNKWNYYLSHYPTMIGNFDNPKKRWNLSGHTHNTDKFNLKNYLIYNVSVDAHNGYPIAFDQIRDEIKELMKYGN